MLKAPLLIAFDNYLASTTMSTHSTGNRLPLLPLEIVYHIISHLHGDVPSLRNCSLTCHALLRYAHGHLFQDISLRRRLMGRFVRLVESNPHIGELVHSLDICYPGMRTLPGELPRFNLLVNLRSLTLRQTNFELMESFFRILEDTPVLVHLACIDMTAGYSFDPIELCQLVEEHPSIARSCPASGPICQRLCRLVVKHGCLRQDTFVQCFLDMGVFAHLDSLDISFGATNEHMHWLPAIRAAHETLRHLRMSMSAETLALGTLHNGEFSIQLWSSG